MLNPKRLELKQNCHMRANELKWVCFPEGCATYRAGIRISF